MPPQPPRVYHCAICGRKLKQDRWVYSSHTGSRYCWPSEGCWLKRKPLLGAMAA